MEAAVFTVIPAFTPEEFTTPACTAAVFINQGPTMGFTIPDIFSRNSIRDFTMVALIRRFIFGDSIEGPTSMGFTQDSIIKGCTASSQDFTANVSVLENFFSLVRSIL